MHTITLDSATLQPTDTPAYLGNGVIGLRVLPIPGLVHPTYGNASGGASGGACTVNGYVGAHPTEKVQAWAYAPYPLALDLRLAGAWWMSQRPDLARFVQQRLDLATGELTSCFEFQVDEAVATVEVVTWISRTKPTLALQEARLRVNREVEVVWRAGVDATGVPGRCLSREAGYFGKQVCDGTLLWESPGGMAQVGLALWTQFQGGDSAPKYLHGYDTGPATEYAFCAQPGREYILHQVTSVIPAVMHREPDRQAVRMVHVASHLGYEAIRRENREAWADIWRGRVLVHGRDGKWQKYADAAYHYLHASIHPSSPCSTGLFGPSMWRDYHYFLGHVFWDIETFAFPPVLLTQPHAARAMLDYRLRHLDAARRNAALNGYRGIQFPWESAPVTGEEVTPSGYPQIIFEQHINYDVAFAFLQYVHATGDRRFALQGALPVLEGVAEWTLSRVSPGNLPGSSSGQYDFKQVMGINEGVITDNNAYVVMAAKVVLRQSAALMETLDFTPPPAWREVADGLRLPVDAATNVVCWNQAHRVTDTAKLCYETLAGFYPYPYRATPAVEEATYRYYLRHGRDSLGWPMIPQLTCVPAARLGERALALEMLERGCGDYFFGPWLHSDEFGCRQTTHKAKVGPYLAHAGGFLMNLMLGLPGLQLGPEAPANWARFPVILPEGFDALEIQRFYARGQPARLLAQQGMSRAQITLH